MTGPNLHGLFGRRAGTLPGFAFSPALRHSGLVWDAATLDAFLADPKRAVPANRMAFPGVRRAEDRRALIDFLKQATR
jgi:cytochrome c